MGSVVYNVAWAEAYLRTKWRHGLSTMVGWENGECLFMEGWQPRTDFFSDEYYIILILHFPFFNYSRSILGFIFDITTLYDCQFLH